MKHDYTFAVWPHHEGWEQPVYEIFKLYPYVTMEFTLDEWQQFRSSLERSGFTLKEITRVPTVEPETIL